MFGFGKKKDKAPAKAAAEAVLTEERKQELLAAIAAKEEAISSLAEAEQSSVYEEIGLAYNELGDEDQAIGALESSLKLKKSVGDGYKALLKLYNKKRAEAAKANDVQSLQTYLKKMDQLMQISKDVTRGVH
ncbi:MULTISPECIES: tetratricopeptide repeat protein [unclassified Paenibacillus]|uniref:tetratricopeptide repeat protein n=1 Tax=unclassified Paenibacillus TaxID=185978 RepID=UPI002405DCBC|nr:MULTISPECIES: tetratricopeptide repeat protein [unclassified Paenibacillus]MDF9840819.1 tetratricopeptide (TPR) repeat protein [Paenibacillus sp. PastF-2]MDF9847402.1 tetratricopeptide (TPR) repeat protein [Paenibacillus sp. PastM-2]MDF9854020.1 tetratricopeptide (TPR) repeat protein [Paenibacillus sp. PastF-1]MDH6479293.1 tetratricopeptide (TPR) repeat protein [Paenibacillus sp. PastH-2]MDH6506972.1 tetratricopeptide (TPR) repeat protein [Paenibacillus sp. PastM-3]